MAGKEVDIRFRTKADSRGAKEAKKGIDEVSRSTDQAADSTNRYAESLARARRATQDGVATLEELTEWLEKKEEAEEKAAEAEKDRAELTRIRRASQAQALARLGRGIIEIGSILRREAAEISAFDEELGNTIESLADVTQATGSAVDGAVKGFAVGGPIGAAFGGLAGLIKNQLLKEFNAMAEALKKQAEAAKRYENAIDGLRKSLEDAGDEAARDRLSKFQERLSGELKTIRQLNDEIDHNIELQRIRRESQQRVADINLKAQLDELDRQVRDGNKSRKEVNLEKASLQAAAQQRQIEAQLAPLLDEIARVSADRDSQNESTEAIQGTIDRLRKVAEQAQEQGDNIQTLTDEDLEAFVRANEDLLKEFGFNLVKQKSSLQSFAELAQGRIEELREELGNSQEEAQQIEVSLVELRERFEARKQGIVDEFNAQAAREAERFSADLEADSRNLIRPIYEGIRDNIAKLGEEATEAQREALEAMEKLASDAIDDRKQRSEFNQLLRQLTKGNIELFQNSFQQMRESEQQLRNLANKVKQLNEDMREIADIVEGIDSRR